MREVDYLADVIKIQGHWFSSHVGFDIFDYGRKAEVKSFLQKGKNKAHAELIAKKATEQIFDAAVWEKARRDVIAAYLNHRKMRASIPSPQLELF